MSMPVVRLFRGIIAHSTASGALQIFPKGALGVDANGKIAFCGDESVINEFVERNGALSDECQHHQLGPTELLLPGLVDTHIHAPQYPNYAQGVDMELLDWLRTLTFPTEARYSDESFAREQYGRCVRRTLSCGTTTAQYFATVHLRATQILAETTMNLGQRALVGLVCMDHESPNDLSQTTEVAVRDTCTFIEWARAQNSPLLHPVITPRFVLSCSDKLLGELGNLARRYDCHVQSHLSENLGEISAVEGRYPGKTYSQVYDDFGLLTNKTVMAHCIHLGESETTLLNTRSVAVAHCANSNYNLMSGVCRVRHLRKAGLTVALGTDVSGGSSPSVLDALRSAVTAAKTLVIQEKTRDAFVDTHEAFYLATLAGAEALRLHEQTGNFEVGKCFDALVVRVDCGLIDTTPLDSPETLLSRFLYLGDDRNIQHVFVNGTRVAGSAAE